MNEFTIIFVIALILSLDVQWWLKLRHLRHVQHHQHTVPEAFSEKISLSEHQKAAEYTLTKTKFALISLVVEAIILLILAISGLVAAVDGRGGDGQHDIYRLDPRFTHEFIRHISHRKQIWFQSNDFGIIFQRLA